MALSGSKDYIPAPDFSFTFRAYLKIDLTEIQMLYLFDRVFTAIAYGAMAIGETLVLAPEYSRAKSGAAHLFALLKKKTNYRQL